MRAQIAKHQPRIAFLAGAALLLALPATAATNSGIAGALFLKHHFSPRAEAMAEAFTAVADDAQAAYWNPAGLARLPADEISTSFSKGVFDDYFSQATYARRLRPQLALSGGLAYYDGGSFDLVDDEGNTQRLAAQRDYLLSLAAGYRLNTEWCLGLTASGLYSTLLDASGFTGAMNLGTVYEPEWLPALRAGAALRHLGPALGYGGARDPLPLCGQAGIAYGLLSGRPSARLHDLTLAADVNVGLDSPVYVNLGAEYWFARSLAVRAGYKLNRALEGLTLGLGIRFPAAEDRLQLDYALGFTAGLDATHKLAVSYLLAAAKPADPPPQPPASGASQSTNQNSNGKSPVGQKKTVSLQVLEVVKDQKSMEPHGQKSAAGGQARLWPLSGRGTNSCHAVSSLAGGDIPEAEVSFIPGHRPGSVKGVKQLILGLNSKTTGLRSGQSGIIFNPGRQAVGKCTLSEIYPTRCVAEVVSLSGEIKPGAQVETEVD